MGMIFTMQPTISNELDCLYEDLAHHINAIEYY